jgi:hypothetical protein
MCIREFASNFGIPTPLLYGIQRERLFCATFMITEIKLVEFMEEFRMTLEARLGATEN